MSKRVEAWLTDEGLELVKGWAREGLTEPEIAKKMGVCVKTLYNWKNAYLPILQALKEGKQVADFKVESALFRRAIGGMYEHTEIIEYPNGTKKTITKQRYIPPDVAACIFWLKNRCSDRWKDHPEQEELIDARIEHIDAKTSKVLNENVVLEDLTESDNIIYGKSDITS